MLLQFVSVFFLDPKGGRVYGLARSSSGVRRRIASLSFQGARSVGAGLGKFCLFLSPFLGRAEDRRIGRVHQEVARCIKWEHCWAHLVEKKKQ